MSNTRRTILVLTGCDKFIRTVIMTDMTGKHA